MHKGVTIYASAIAAALRDKITLPQGQQATKDRKLADLLRRKFHNTKMLGVRLNVSSQSGGTQLSIEAN